MKQNVGSTERVVRIGAGVVAGVAALRVRSRILSTLLLALAGGAIQTGITRYCKVNEMLGLGEQGLEGKAKLSGARKKLAAA